MLVTISDKKNPVDENGDQYIDYYNPDIITAIDYYPFGMQMPGRTYRQANSSYRYGFNGKENDNEVKGEGNQQDYGMRIYDPRLGRFLSVDPLTNKYPELTPYQFASNMPIIAVDLDGQEAKIVTVYHSMSGGKEFYKTVDNDRSPLGLVLNMTTTVHKYPTNALIGVQYNQVGPSELSFNRPVNFQTGRIDLSDQTLGKLSEKFESGGPGTVSTGKGDHGGVSYGSWQLASNMNRPRQFLQNEGKQWADDFGNTEPGTPEFSAVWKGIAKADPVGFKKAQHDYIKRTHYDVVVNNVKINIGLDINARSAVLRDVAWSTAVQHGPDNDIFETALDGKDASKLSDAEIITLVYAERGRKDKDGVLVHFRKSDKDMQAGVSKRYKKEEAEALKKLDSGTTIVNNSSNN